MSPAVSPELAIQFPTFARKVKVRPGDKLTDALARAPVDWLTLEKSKLATLPAVVGKLTLLRVLDLTGARNLTKIPASVLALPNLSHLYLDGTGVKNLDGIERSTSLRIISLRRTPLGKTKELEAFAERVGAVITDPGELRLRRGIPPAPKNRAKLLKVIRDGSLDSWTDLKGVNLSGAKFDGIELASHATKANLAKSVWTRCEIHCDLTGANLEGATFENCIINATMTKVRAKGATFRNCYLYVSLTGADLTAARFLDLEPDCILDLAKAKARKLQLELRVTEPKQAKLLKARNADLRDATITFALTDEARAKKPDPKRKWSTGDFFGAKLGKTTRIEYAPLP